MGGDLAHDELAMVDYARSPRLLLIADDPWTLRSVEGAADAAGCRLIHAPLAETGERIADARAYDAIYLHVDREDAEQLLGPVGRHAEGRTRFVVGAPLQFLDLATTSWGSSIMHTCNPNAGEQAAALAWALEREPERLHDSSRGTSRLHQLSEEVGRIASVLASLSDADTERRVGSEQPVDAARIRSIIRARRLRDQYLRGDLFADPAWDMMLDLMAARLEGQRVPVSSLCMAAAVPPTTALRWIKALAEQGVFVRIADPEDGRRIYIELAEDIAKALEAYLRAAQRVTPNLF